MWFHHTTKAFRVVFNFIMCGYHVWLSRTGYFVYYAQKLFTNEVGVGSSPISVTQNVFVSDNLNAFLAIYSFLCEAFNGLGFCRCSLYIINILVS